MTTFVSFSFGASASSHSILDYGSGFTCGPPLFEALSPSAAYESAVAQRFELLRAIEREEWSQIEQLVPGDAALSRIAGRFRPPPEWFNEEDVL